MGDCGSHGPPVAGKADPGGGGSWETGTQPVQRARLALSHPLGGEERGSFLPPLSSVPEREGCRGRGCDIPGGPPGPITPTTLPGSLLSPYFAV